MRILMNFLWEVILCSALLCCIMCDQKNDSAKESAEDANKNVFTDKESRVDAQFIVDAVDRSYGLLEIAELGRTRGVSAEVKEQANQLIDGQKFMIQELQNYAISRSISAPIDGPEKTVDAVKELYTIDVDNFDEAWKKQMLAQTRKLMHDFEHQELFDRSKQKVSSQTGSLEKLIETVLSTLRAHEELLIHNPAQKQANHNAI